MTTSLQGLSFSTGILYTESLRNPAVTQDPSCLRDRHWIIWMKMGGQGQRRRHGKFLSYEMKVSEHESRWVTGSRQSALWRSNGGAHVGIISHCWLLEENDRYSRKSVINFYEPRQLHSSGLLPLFTHFIPPAQHMGAQLDWSREAELRHTHTHTQGLFIQLL